MIKTILIIILSVTFFGVLFFILVRNALKRKLDVLLDEEKKKYANHFLNLRPLWPKENFEKGARLNKGFNIKNIIFINFSKFIHTQVNS